MGNRLPQPLMNSPERSRLWFVVPLLAIFAVLLYLAEVTHSELLSNLTTMPVEMIVGAILIEEYIARNEQQRRIRQLMFIKSFIFRTDLRDLYIANFAALEEPAITMAMIRRADLPRLRQMRKSAETIRYRSTDAMEGVIREYIHAYPVFYGFMEWAMANDFDRIFDEMIFVLHFIQDIKLFKQRHPDQLFAQHAEADPQLMGKLMRLLGTGVEKFLDYAIELKIKQPTTFDDLLADYEAYAKEPSTERPDAVFFRSNRSLFGALMRDS
jgi:hypothetical protein